MKLYWRVKRNGKWTYIAVDVREVEDDSDHKPDFGRWYFIAPPMEES